MSGLVGGQKADTKAVEAQMAQQRAETEKLRQQAEEEKRSLAEQAAANRMSRSRGGNRLLLAEERLSPEAGIDEQTLGAA